MLENFKKYLDSNLGNFSIGLGVFGMLVHLWNSYLSQNLSFIRYLNLFDISDPLLGPLCSTIREFIKFSPLTVLFYFMLIAGGYYYKKSHKRDARLLQFCYSILLISKMLGFWYIFSNYVYHIDEILKDDFGQARMGYLLFFIALLLFWIFIFYTIIKIVFAEKAFKYEEIAPANDYEPSEVEFHEVIKNKRLAHLVFDAIIAFVLIGPAFIAALRFFPTGYHLDSGIIVLFQMKYGVLYIVTIFTIYYIIFEGFFQTTPAKMLTGTKVVDINTFEKPSFGQILGRSLCRRIPFDGLSYYEKDGWHDRFSNTVLVEEEDFGESRTHHRIWGVLLLLLFAIVFLLSELH